MFSLMKETKVISEEVNIIPKWATAVSCMKVDVLYEEGHFLRAAKAEKLTLTVKTSQSNVAGNQGNRFNSVPQISWVWKNSIWKFPLKKTIPRDL